jgi:hypothetical protein
MDKEKIIKKASKILGISANDKHLREYLFFVEQENYGLDLTDEVWAYGLVAYYTFCYGMFDEWKEYQAKFNQALLGVGK